MKGGKGEGREGEGWKREKEGMGGRREGRKGKGRRGCFTFPLSFV